MDNKKLFIGRQIYMKKEEKYIYKTEINAEEYAKMISFFPKIGF